MFTALEHWDRERWSRLTWLCEWLNREGDSVLKNAQSQVKEALVILRRMNSEPPPRTGSRPEKQGWSWADPHGFRALERIFAQIPLRSMLTGDRHGRVAVSIGVVRPIEITRGLYDLAMASETHLLDRLRDCKRCGKWFVAKHPKKAFCSPDCQQESWSEYRKTPQGKKEQRKKMQEWRAKQRGLKGRIQR